MNNQENVTYFEARKWASFRIKESNDIDMYDVDFLLEKLFKMSATDLLIHYHTQMPDKQWQVFQDAIGQLLKGAATVHCWRGRFLRFIIEGHTRCADSPS